MSKVDGPRAIREARHAAYRAAQSKAGAVRPASSDIVVPAEPVDGEQAAQPAVDQQPPKKEPKRSPKKAKARSTAPDSDAASAASDASEVSADADALCGHRSMNGRSCRRPAGHSEKSHRYS